MRLRGIMSLLGLCALAPAAVVLAHPDLDVFERAAAEEIAQHPESPQGYLRLAESYQVAHEWDAALVALAQAAEHGADRDEVGAMRGRIFLDAGWPRMAKLEADSVLARQPDRFAVLYLRGCAWMKLGHPDDAAADFARAIAGQPSPRPEQVFAHRDALLAAGKPADAVAALDAGMGRIGKVPSLMLAAIDLEEDLGRYDEALARLDRLLAGNPRNEAWLARRGEILRRAGRHDEARVAYGAALAAIEARPAPRRGERMEALAREVRTALAAAPKGGQP